MQQQITWLMMTDNEPSDEIFPVLFTSFQQERIRWNNITRQRGDTVQQKNEEEELNR